MMNIKKMTALSKKLQKMQQAIDKQIEKMQDDNDFEVQLKANLESCTGFLELSIEQLEG